MDIVEPQDEPMVVDIEIPTSSSLHNVPEFHNYYCKAFVETEAQVPATVQCDVELPSIDDKDDCDNCKVKIEDYKAEIALLKAQLETEKQHQCSKHLKEIELLENQLTTQVESNKKLASTIEKLSVPWNPDEIKKLCEGGKVHKWSELSLAKHIRLYYKVGSTAYKFLLEEGFPFAKIRTIQDHVRNISVEPGILHDFAHMMRSKVGTMHPKERFCSLAIDEMAIQAKRDFDPTTQAFIGHPTIKAGPKLIEKRNKEGVESDEILATHGLNILVCGLSTKWTQLIAYEFSDKSVDPIAMKDLIHGVIRILYEIGLTVVNITTDMNTDNLAL